MLLGYFIDSKYDSEPAGVLIGLSIGLIAGFYHLAKTIWGDKS
jgi:F0F1-type ATP synthase assembly protein I